MFALSPQTLAHLVIFLKIYLFEREKVRGGSEGEGETSADSTPNMEPDMGLNLKTQRS